MEIRVVDFLDFENCEDLKKEMVKKLKIEKLPICINPKRANLQNNIMKGITMIMKSNHVSGGTLITEVEQICLILWEEDNSRIGVEVVSDDITDETVNLLEKSQNIYYKLYKESKQKQKGMSFVINATTEKQLKEGENGK